MNGVAGGDVVADVAMRSSSSLVLTQTATVDRPMTELGTHAAKSSHKTSITDPSQTEPELQESSEKEDKERAPGLELDEEQLLKHRASTIIITAS